jgi:hypothetical protein
LSAETGDGRDDLQSLFLGALGGNASHESLLHGLTASSALALDVGGTALGGRQSSDEARNSALGDLGKVLGAGESEGSREGKDGSLETHVCFGGWWCLCERVVLVLRIDWNGITEDFCAKSKMESKATEDLEKGKRDLINIHRGWGTKLRKDGRGRVRFTQRAGTSTINSTKRWYRQQ